MIQSCVKISDVCISKPTGHKLEYVIICSLCHEGFQGHVQGQGAETDQKASDQNDVDILAKAVGSPGYLSLTLQ